MSELPNNCKRLREQLKKSLEREAAIEKELEEARTQVTKLSLGVNIACDNIDALKAQVKERELTIEKIEAKCCQCHAEHVAQVAVLRGELSADLRVFKNLNRYPFNCDEAIKRVENALSTTPAEAVERVNGIVEALEKLARLGGLGGGYGNSDGNVIAQRALAAWRGQES